jgi:hypothetical protein
MAVLSGAVCPQHIGFVRSGVIMLFACVSLCGCFSLGDTRLGVVQKVPFPGNTGNR